MLNNLRKLNALFTSRDRTVFLILIVLMIIGALLEVVGIGVVPLFLAIIADPQQVRKYPLVAPLLNYIGPLQSNKMIYVGSAVLVTIFILKNTYLIFNRYLQLRVLQNRQMGLMRRLFHAYMHAPYEFHLQRNTAELLRNVYTNTQMISQNVLSPLMNFAMACILTLSILLLLILVNLWITLLSLFVLGLALGLLLTSVRKKMNRFGEQAQAEHTEIVKTINQGLGGLKELRLLRREDSCVNYLAAHARTLAKAQAFWGIIDRSTIYYLETVAVVMLLGICVLLKAFGTPLQSILPLLALFALALVRLKTSASTLFASINTLLFQIHCVAPVYEDLRLLEQANNRPKNPSLQDFAFQREIKLSSISYRYPGGHTDVLSDVNLSIEKGASVAFIGPTGSGKTTLVDLILGLLPSSAGSILVDGVDIHENLAGWQRNIGYVPQTIYLTDDTIRRNIALGLENHQIDNEKLWAAIRSAQLEDFVQSLPMAEETLVGERGMRISGGQRQRIGIARALYHNPQLLVFDEGTSALDNETEAAVIRAIESLRGERTILMIAHRLSTTKNCDRRYLLDGGKLSLKEDSSLIEAIS